MNHHVQRLTKTSLVLLLGLVATAGLLSGAGTASAQLVTVKEDYYVTEIRRDKSLIGVSLSNNHETRNWVKVESQTRIARRVWVTRSSYRDVVISQAEMWKRMRPGTKFKVSGGRDWDQTIVAKQIWL